MESMTRTFDEINEKIRRGQVAVITAEEAVAMARECGVREAARRIDVVTCATFGPMCSTGAFINFGHSDPRIRMTEITLNNVPASGGLAAVDTYIGATEQSRTEGMSYGGAHVIEDLIAGRPVTLRASSPGTDCYPRRSLEATLTLADLNQAYLYNPRNCYQNYPAATNSSGRALYTYMGTLLPDYGNVTYSTSGELSPLLKDPELRTIGIGTRIFLAGAQGYVAWQGTQYTRGHDAYEDGDDFNGATLAVIGDMSHMNPRYIRAAVFPRYGVTMFVGLGIPIPVLDEDLMDRLSRPNERIFTQLVDYSTGQLSRPTLGRVSYAQLRSGSIDLAGRVVPTAPLSSLYMAREIAELLKQDVSRGEFLLQEPVEMLPVSHPMKPMAGVKEERLP
jgi:uncharacterized protein (DUF39 family)